jgi:hypothetical protein
MADDVVTVRGADVGADAAPPSVEEALSGDFGREPFWLPPALRNGDAVRLALDGVPVRDGGLLGRLMVGLSHEEKKSSPGSPAGVLVSLVASSATSMTTVSGYL